MKTYKTQKGSGTRKLTSKIRKRLNARAKKKLIDEKGFIRSLMIDISFELNNIKDTKLSNDFPRHINDLFDNVAKCLQESLTNLNTYKNSLDERLFGRPEGWNKLTDVKNNIRMERKKINEKRIKCDRIHAKLEEAIDALPDIQSPISVNISHPSLASTLSHHYSLSNHSNQSSRSSGSGNRYGRRSRRSRRTRRR